MFLTRIASTVSGRSTRGARRSYAPDGKLIGEFFWRVVMEVWNTRQCM